MKWYILLHIIIGACIASAYYYLQLKRDRRNNDTFAAVWIGVLWPVAAPFAFGFYFARMMSERDDKR